MTSANPPRRAVTIVVAALLGALVTWVVAEAVRGPDTVGAGLPETAALADPGGSSPPTATGDGGSASGASDRIRTRPAGLRPGAATTPPTALSIPRLAVELPVAPTGLAADGQMALPESNRRLGWYRFGPGPFSARGATVLGGHVDTAEGGAGPLALLASLRPGDRLEVASGGRTVPYVVRSVARIAKTRLDTAAVFSRIGPPRLHLLTCGGAYLPDRGGYQDNVVVVARPVP